MKIFQNSVLNKYLKTQDEKQIDIMYSQFTSYFHNAEIQENIGNSKEEQFQEGFLRELFVKILGYTLNPEPNFNLTTELKNEKGAKKTDGAILKNGKALAVIELKGTDTKDLDKVNEQAFNYKNNHTDCVYVITSNFEKLRFFIHNAVAHIEFNLFTLTKDEFKILWLCLSAENLLAGVPAKIKEDSIIVEENVTKQLYKDYSTFKHELWQNICKNRPDLDKLLLFKKTQKLLDRFLFVFFAEDSGLLPPNSISRMVERFEQLIELDAQKPLYEIFKQYFGYINKGRKGKTTQDDIFAYNGGLFLPDEILDKLIIDDDVLKPHVLIMTAYDFQSDVDVNILGHIFENSLNEIENVTAQLEEQELDKSKTKRKKDGVFYTPKYITKYIVENTVGKLCEEKKAELKIIDEEYAKGRKNRKKTTVKTLYHNLQEYRNWLLEITICDPACGSGAFLNQALEFLINEHAYIDELQANLLEASMVLQDVSNHVLEKNIFGVDINDESVEIAKLSLWLRTAQRGRKLTSLNNNIKCGNSLIDDPEVAGEKAFNWKNEFPQVFENGGFDVIIGNPPYVRIQQLGYEIIDFLKNYYKTALKRIDISLCFIELSSKIVKKDIGLTSFITSNQFLTTEYGQAMRKFLLNEYNIVECIDFGDLRVFADALTYVSIFTFSKYNNETFNYTHINSIVNAIENNFGKVQIIDKNQLSDNNWNLKDFSKLKIWNKIQYNTKQLSEIGNAWYGIITGADNIYIFSKEQFLKTSIEKELFIPLLRAQNCTKYFCLKPEHYILYPYKMKEDKTIPLTENELKQNYPEGYQYLLSHKNQLEARKDSRSTYKGRVDWYSLTRFGQFDVFNKTKIVTPGEVKQHKFCLDYDNSGFSGARVFAITIDEKFVDEKFVLSVLNSELMKSFLQSFSSLKSGGYYSYSSNILNKAPIKTISSEAQQPFVEKADLMLLLNKNLQTEKNNFLNTLQEEKDIEKMTKKIDAFYELEYDALKKELAKQKVKISLGNENNEWREYFNTTKQKINELQSQINQTDKEIDKMVYELYELTDEEIEIVENSVK